MGGRALDRVCGKIKYDENVFFSLPVGAVCINSAVMAFDVLNYSGHFAKPDQRHTVKWENDRNACGRIKKKKKRRSHRTKSIFWIVLPSDAAIILFSMHWQNAGINIFGCFMLIYLNRLRKRLRGSKSDCRAFNLLDFWTWHSFLSSMSPHLNTLQHV